MIIKFNNKYSKKFTYYSIDPSWTETYQSVDFVVWNEIKDFIVQYDIFNYINNKTNFAIADFIVDGGWTDLKEILKERLTNEE
jgi:hypothetical protein